MSELLSLDLEGTTGAWVMRGDPTKDVPAVANFFSLSDAEQYVEWRNAQILAEAHPAPAQLTTADGTEGAPFKMMDRVKVIAITPHGTVVESKKGDGDRDPWRVLVIFDDTQRAAWVDASDCTLITPTDKPSEPGFPRTFECDNDVKCRITFQSADDVAECSCGNGFARTLGEILGGSHWREITPAEPAKGEVFARVSAAVEARKEIHALKAANERLTRELAREEAAHSTTIDQRDYATEKADAMASILANLIDSDAEAVEVIGEHSSGNCPWQQAIDRSEEIGKHIDELRSAVVASNDSLTAAVRRAEDAEGRAVELRDKLLLLRDVMEQCPISQLATLDMRFEWWIAHRYSALLKANVVLDATKPAALAPTTGGQGEKRDWRIGKKCKPKYRTHRFFMDRTIGLIQEVHPDGFAGLSDKDGILRIRLDTGMEVLEPSDQWVTA